MHLTEEQLNEYLDHETTERAQMDLHLAQCVDCAARLAALQALFNEIESLPDLASSRDLAARFRSDLNLDHGLPRWFKLTVSLQAVLALITLFVASPFIANLFPSMQSPSFVGMLLQLQPPGKTWVDMLTQIQMPVLPEMPMFEISSLIITLTLAGISLIWLIGNELLLRHHFK